MLSGNPPADADEKLSVYLTESERVQTINQEVYMITDSFGNSKLSNALIEKKLGLSATARNWNTITKLSCL
jgi:uncharacterized protein (DUF1697 family)